MASGRFLSVSIAEDDKLSRLSMTAELIYLKAIPHLDRDGMITGKPGLLYSKVCPTREELFGATQEIMDEWVDVGLVIRFTTPEGPVLFFLGFAKNNNLPHYERERPSRFPAPPGYYRAEKGIFKNGDEPPVKKPKTDSNQVLDEVQELVQELVHRNTPEFDSEEQDKDQDKEQASRSAPALPAIQYADDETALIALAYHTVGAFAPSSQTEKGKTAIRVATELLERFGYERCAGTMDTLKERHLAAIKEHRRGISAPLPYLQTLLEDDRPSGGLLSGDKLFEENAWQVLLNQPLPDYMGQ